MGKQLSEIRPGRKRVRGSVMSSFLYLLFQRSPAIMYNPLQRAEIKSTLEYQYEAAEK